MLLAKIIASVILSAAATCLVLAFWALLSAARLVPDFPASRREFLRGAAAVGLASLVTLLADVGLWLG